MKISKRIGALSLALLLTLSALAGCGKKNPEGSGSSGASSSAGDSSQLQEMDLTKVTDPYLTVSGLAGDAVVAKVGGEDITAAELLYWLSRTTDSYLDQFGGLSVNIPWDTDVGEGITIASRMIDSALNTAATYRAFSIIAGREGLSPDPAIPESANQEFAGMVEQLGSEEVVTHILWDQLLNQDLLISLNQASDLYAKLQDRYFGVDSDSYPTDAEVMAWLDEGGYFRVKHILLMTMDQDTREPLDEETVAQKKATADDLLAQLRAAEDPISLFDTLMQENSEDGGLVANPNGYIFNAQDSLVGGFREATLALDVGDISDVVETDYGYHIMLRLPIDPADYRDEVITDGMQAKADQWLEELGVEKTADFDKLDPADIWEKLTALRTAIRQEVDAVQSREDASNGGQS